MTTDVRLFSTLEDVMRDLRARFVKELPTEAHESPGPHLAEFVGTLSGLVTTLNRLDQNLHALERHDPLAFDAFLRAMENPT